MFFIDPMYFVFVGPAMLLALWAQWKVKSAYQRGSKIPSRSGLTGAETAQLILDANGIGNTVRIEPVQSFLGDHYDPRHKVLRLSPDNYSGRSLAAQGIAAHEVGHAIQDATHYGPLKLRNALVPMASAGSTLSWILIFAGLMLSYSIPVLGKGVAIAGLVGFGAVVIFQLINLPVEFNASSRAREILVAQGIIDHEEDREVKRVLDAAAMTYVAATITAALTMLYYAYIIFGRRD